MGRVLLAALTESEARAILARSELKQNTANTRTDPDELIAEFRRVRTEGYAIIDQELEIGLCSIAVPIDNDRGETVAAINIGALSRPRPGGGDEGALSAAAEGNAGGIAAAAAAVTA